jgi:hypothetical protein
MARLDKPGRTGYQAFVKVNLFNNLAGNAIVTDPALQGTQVPTPKVTLVALRFSGVVVAFDLPANPYSVVLWIYDPTAYFHKQIARVVQDVPPVNVFFNSLITKTGISEPLTAPIHLFGQLYTIDPAGNTSPPGATFPIDLTVSVDTGTMTPWPDTAQGQLMPPQSVPIVDANGAPVGGVDVFVSADIAVTFDPSSTLQALSDPTTGIAVFDNLRISPTAPPGPRVVSFTIINSLAGQTFFSVI